MPARIREKTLFTGIALLLSGLLTLSYVHITSTPLRLSKKGIAIALIAVALLIAAARLMVRSLHKA